MSRKADIEVLRKIAADAETIIKPHPGPMTLGERANMYGFLLAAIEEVCNVLARHIEEGGEK